MTATLVVRRPGICSTVQDLGRPGLRAIGVPASGALDAYALRLANALVGNPENTAAIEMLYSGATLTMRGGSARIAMCGAEATIVRAATTQARALSQWHTATLEDGDEVRLGPVRATAAAYLAIAGGIDVAPVLGSASTYLRGALGGWHGRALRVGDALPLARSHAATGAERTFAIAPALHAPGTLRVMAGPQADRFERASIDTLLAHEYTVSTASDRSGLRLEGEPLRHVGGYDLSSEGVACGSIQVPGAGQPVILIGDHPTVGGYPKIATIVSADLPAAGRLRIGARVRFHAVDEVEARLARAQAQADYARIVQSIADARV